MKTKYIVVLVLLLTVGIASQANASDVIEKWNESYGGSPTSASSINQTSDGGYFITGYVVENSGSYRDFKMIKTYSNGTIEWETVYGTINKEDKARSGQQTTDGGYIVAGVSRVGSYNDGRILKLHSSGSEEWSVTYGNSVTYYTLNSIQQTTDGGYIGFGNGEYNIYYGQDFWLIKMNESGSREWETYYDIGSVKYVTNGVRSQYGNSVQQTFDSGYILAGDYYDGSDMKGWVVKTNETGIEEWNMTYGDSSYNTIRSIYQTSDNGYIFTGMSDPDAESDYDLWLVKINDTGVEQWNKTFGGNEDESGKSVKQTSDGGYIVSGYTDVNGGTDIWTIKTNSLGSEEWNMTFDTNSNSPEPPTSSAQETTDGDFVVVGNIDRSIFLAKIGTNNAPVLNSILPKIVDEGSLLTFTLNATDSENDPLTFSAIGLPTNATLNTSTGVFTWTPDSTQSGNYTVQFNVTDGSSIDTENATITVNDIPVTPPIKSSSSGSSSGGIGSATIITVEEEEEETVEEEAPEDVTSDEKSTDSEDTDNEVEKEAIGEEQPLEKDKSTPGFTSMLMIIGIIGAVLIANCRRD